MNHNIAIDGPSGAGKSTLAKKVAKQLNYLYLDTGAMYRALGLYAMENGVDFTGPAPDAENRIKGLLPSFHIDITYQNGTQQVHVNGKNVTKFIRTPEVSIAASKVAAIPEVRVKLVELQRKIASEHDVVMDGRDIGSYVLPDAQIKIFLTASPEVRAMRRLKELKRRGASDVTFSAVLQDMQYRDKNDSTRAFAPLVQAEDAVLLDTSALTQEESIAALIQIVKDKLREN